MRHTRLLAAGRNPTNPGIPLRGAPVTEGLGLALFSGNYNCVADATNRALNRLVAHGLARGLEARMYAPTAAEPAFPAVDALVSVPSIPIHGRPDSRLAPWLPEAVASDVRHFAPDLIHVSAPDGLGAGAVRLARRMGIPVVASLHTRFETYLEYYGLGVVRSVAELWLRRFYNRCDILLVPSESVGDEIRTSGITTPMRVWSLGVDRAQFHPSRRDMQWRRTQGFGDREVVVLFFSGLALEKGLETFATMISDLRAAGLPVRPLILGDGPERQRYAERLGDAVFTGKVEGAALARAIASADVFVNPSVTEAFDNVTLEAMASGVVTIAADVPWNSALIADHRTGRLVEAAASEAYVRAILELVAAPQKRIAMSWLAAETARRFSWPATLDVVIDAYGEVCGRALGRSFGSRVAATTTTEW